jgi:hypothetical protein
MIDGLNSIKELDEDLRETKETEKTSITRRHPLSSKDLIEQKE